MKNASSKASKVSADAPKLGRDDFGRSVPGFLGRGNPPTAEARSYGSWNQKKGPDEKSTVISLPEGGSK